MHSKYKFFSHPSWVLRGLLISKDNECNLASSLRRDLPISSRERKIHSPIKHKFYPHIWGDYFIQSFLWAERATNTRTILVTADTSSRAWFAEAACSPELASQPELCLQCVVTASAAFQQPSCISTLEITGIYLHLAQWPKSLGRFFFFFSAFFFLHQYTSWKTDSLSKDREHWEDECKINSAPLGFSIDPGQGEK